MGRAVDPDLCHFLGHAIIESRHKTLWDRATCREIWALTLERVLDDAIVWRHRVVFVLFSVPRVKVPRHHLRRTLRRVSSGAESADACFAQSEPPACSPTEGRASPTPG